MKVKKFTCISCGAPKVNPYKSPYIMCDYCGMLMDLDFSLAMELWNQRTVTNTEFDNTRHELDYKLSAALEKGDRNEYLKYQREYWDTFYKAFSYYLPPSVNDDKKYNKFIDIYSRSHTYAAFDDKWKRYRNKQNELMEELVYEMNSEGPKVQAEGFFKVAEFFIKASKESIEEFYSNPDFSFVFDIVPSNVQLKLKLTDFVQAWLPYLSENDAERFLKMTGFSTQYVELERPSGETGKCSYCKAEIYIPQGAFKVYCEACRRTTKVQSTFKCMSCGADNNVPDNPGKPIDCEYCGVENRLIQRLFG